MQKLTQAQINIITHQQPRVFNANETWCMQRTMPGNVRITGEGKTLDDAAADFARKVTDFHTTSSYDHPENDTLG